MIVNIILIIIIIITYQNITKNTQHKKKIDISLYEMNTEVIMVIANVGQLIVIILAIR